MSMSYPGSNYATAGAVFADDVRFHVSDHAYLPDGDAGTDLAGAYRADHRRQRKRKYEMSVKSVCILALALAMACAVSVLRNLYEANDLEKQIGQMQAQISVTQAQTVDLKREVEKNKDLSRIGYLAVHELGMIASDDTNMVKMYVPAVERFSGSVVRTVEVPSTGHMMEAAVASR